MTPKIKPPKPGAGHLGKYGISYEEKRYPPNELRVILQPRQLRKVSLARLSTNTSVKNAGWDSDKLARLDKSLQSVLKRFKDLTGREPGFDIVLAAYPPFDGKSMCEFSERNKALYVYLRSSPADVLEFAPYILSYRLTEVIFDQKGNSEVMAERPLDLFETVEGYIEDGVRDFIRFLKTERRIKKSEQKIGSLFSAFINDTYNYILKTKILFYLLPDPIPKAPILGWIMRELGTLRNNAKLNAGKSEEEQDMHAWEYIKHLAGLSATAKIVGIPELERQCFSMISTDFGQLLSKIELKQLPLTSVSDTSPEKAIKGFQLLFEIFKRITLYFYNTLQVG